MNKILTLMTIATLSLAQTFNVSTTPELRVALETAATNGEDDTIILADGTYKTTDDGVGTFIYLSNEGYLLTLLGSSSANVILSGDSQNQIFNHNSTLNAPLKIEKLSFVDGNNTNGNGGGVYTAYGIDVVDCSFRRNTSSNGGGIYSYSNTTNIKRTTFDNNKAIQYGGAVYSRRDIIIKNTIFNGNVARRFNSGGFYAYYKATVYNSMFVNNEGGAFGVSQSVVILVNSSILNNTEGIKLSFSNDSTIRNSIFLNNNNDDISGQSTSIVSIFNTYIDISNVSINNISSDNVFDGITLGFVDENNGDYNLTVSSDLIDSGTITGISLSTTDLNGNARLSGGNVDIGPYEFSTTRPIITSISYTGVTQEFSELTFNVNYSLTSPRTISTVEYDYLNDGVFTTANTHTYTTAGTYKVYVSVTDDTGDFSSTFKTITILELPYSEMTYDQKLVKTIEPSNYDDIIALIASEKNAAVRDMNTTATARGIEDGKQYVQDNLAEFDLVAKSELKLTAVDISTFPSGWTLTSTPFEITDLSIFDTAIVIWVYNNLTSTWSAYSSDAVMAQKIIDSNSVSTLSSISAGSAVWIQK